MTTKQSKKTAAPEVVEQNGDGVTASLGSKTYPAQPGQLIAVSETDLLISAPWMNDGYSANRCFGLRAGQPTLLPVRVLQPNTDGWRLHTAGMFTIVTDEVEGVLPEVVDAADSRERTIWTTGAPPPINHEQLVDHWTGVVVSRSLAASIVECIEAGIDPKVAATTLGQVYDDSHLSRPSTVSQEPWRARASEMVAAHRAREAGLV